jgi:hypothetical protein
MAVNDALFHQLAMIDIIMSMGIPAWVPAVFDIG